MKMSVFIRIFKVLRETKQFTRELTQLSKEMSQLSQKRKNFIVRKNYKNFDVEIIKEKDHNFLINIDSKKRK